MSQHRDTNEEKAGSSVSTQQVGKVRNLSPRWLSHLQDSSDKIQFDEYEPQLIPTFEDLEDYPYYNQTKVTGSFTYYSVDRSGERVPYRGEYQYRTGSELFIIDSPTDRIPIRDVFAYLEDQLSSEFEVKRTLSLDRIAFWDFLNQAHSIETLKLRGPEGTYDAAVLLNLLRKENPIEELWNTEFRRDVDQDALEGILKSVDAAGDNISSLHDLDIDLYNTMIKKCEALYFTPEGVAEFEFEGGYLSITGDDGAREYLLQLFERDVIHPSSD